MKFVQEVPDHPVIHQMERTGEYHPPYEHSTVHPWFGFGPMPAGAVHQMCKATMEALDKSMKGGETE